MTSHAHNGTTKDSTIASPTEPRPTSSTFSASNTRYSTGSNDTGESNTAVSNRNSFATSTLNDGDDNQQGDLGTSTNDGVKKDSRTIHKPHNKGKSGGGFLLSGSIFHRSSESPPLGERPSRTRSLLHDFKGKSSDKKNTKRISSSGASAGSPLASNVVSAPIEEGAENEVVGDTNAPRLDENRDVAHVSEQSDRSSGLDVDSAQIVNLALNLSESRRIASRRNISTPLPSAGPALGEGFPGGSLRQHLQQQRRTSRNISPKPDRNDRVLSSVPRVSSGLRINPVPGTFDSPESIYQYHFSSSTLARAEKAKKAIELMAQYRRLLQYIPPLKVSSSEKGQNTSPSGPVAGSSTSAQPASSPDRPQRVFGRQYNPLQYIRNRKVRARARINIDGEAQGFGNVHKVSWWVDEVSKAALHDDFINGHRVALPPFSKTIEDESAIHTSPESAGPKSQAAPKVVRPRIDWAINPADMLADIYWLEQDDNKSLIEDRSGRLIFPAMPRAPESSDIRKSSDRSHGKKGNGKKGDAALDLRIDTKLPDFRSFKHELEKQPESAGFKSRHKLHEATNNQHGSGASSREKHRFLRSRSRSSSESSDSEHIGRFSKRRRSGTMESQDHGRDILEKQMLEMMAKESGNASFMTPEKLVKQNTITSIETSLPNSAEKSDSSISLHRKAHSRNASRESPTKKRTGFPSMPSGRPSLDVPGISPRTSLEGLDSTAPNSPQVKASKLVNSFVPSIGLDLSSPKSRKSSPNRKRPLSRVRSKINHFRDHSREPSNERDQPDMSRVSIDSIDSRLSQTPDTPYGRNRSISPTKKLLSKGTDESAKSLKKQTSLRKGKGEESGIRGLFKGTRGPVARVSDFLWKRDGNNSGPSTDESDTDDYRQPTRKSEKKPPLDRQDTDAIDADISPDKTIPTYINNMPSFKSPFENRGRSTRARKPEGVPDSEASEPEYSSKTNLAAPRIDIHKASPASSPDLEPAGRRVSDVSDVSTRRGSYTRGVRSADSRINAILGYPGQRRNALPVTGLSILEANQNRRPSLDGKRQWSISDSGVSAHRGPTTKREIARVRTLLLSSGIKANEIARRAAEPKDLRDAEEKCYEDIASFAEGPLMPVPKSQQHMLAARILQNDVQLSSRLWQQSADNFSMTTIQNLLNDMGELQSRLVENLTPMTRRIADDADEVSKDLVTGHILQVNKLTDSMDKMMRRRRRRFRWVRRGGWVMVEWALVGVMWYVWFMVVLARVIMGIGRGAVGAVRWLFWL
ncbi:upf0183 domain containing protein [Rutstroemia sp. NJR-2017a BVV2]|nr:upf0183 domain containing protein [Rutstroemia sp. NJR-2017a BVV2]PQE09354.1 upf0183 domain containing protein [Rutstroemia sp. NJR-2017a BVV2]